MRTSVDVEDLTGHLLGFGEIEHRSAMSAAAEISSRGDKVRRNPETAGVSTGPGALEESAVDQGLAGSARRWVSSRNGNTSAPSAQTMITAAMAMAG